MVLITLFLAYVYWESEQKSSNSYQGTSFSDKQEKVLEPFVLKHEVYGDKKIFDQPRIQFVWRGPNRDNAEIWSVKIDGTDLRLAADAGLLYEGNTDIELSVVFKPVRSPNNRYILVNINDDKTNDIAIHIIDLKNKTNKEIIHDGEVFGLKYPWVSDSQSFFYIEYHKGTLSRYYLESDKIESIRKTSYAQQYVQQTAEIISEIFNDEFVQWDFKGNELKRVSLGENVHNTTHAVSPDGSYFIYKNYEGAYFLPTKSISGAQKLPRTASPILTWKGKGIVEGGTNIFYYNTSTKKDILIFKKYGGDKINDKLGFHISDLSLFNEANTGGE
jgi:hypothetical protein